MTDKLRLTIPYEEPDDEGWVVARVVEVPGAVLRQAGLRR
jgi:hypothetical protein